MKDVELRLAMVCYGGVSLAVYMHGVTKEFLKLARASRTYHALPKGPSANGTTFDEAPQNQYPEADTESIYFDLLKEVGASVDLRVVIDVIAGASAGGINGIILARALAHDLPLAPLRDVWLREADINELLAENRAARVWSKWFLRPLVYGYVRRIGESDPEMREKLSRFLRSRWFRPPFDGQRLAAVLHNAMHDMGEPAQPGASLLPEGQRLDLVVTVTDFYGYPQRVPMYDPPFVTEREHRHTLHFAYQRRRSGEEISQFTSADVPSLAFAARATSSFPGAFPPAQLAEMDAVCRQLGIPWTTRAAFVEDNFQRYAQAGVDPALTSFVDGSVLNNKPIAQAMDLIRTRSANRQIDRRIVYIDPDPAPEPLPPDGRRPSWFGTLKGALSDLPRNQPVFDDLSWVRDYNRRAQNLKASIEAARPQITERVRQLTGRALARVSRPEHLGKLREEANAEAARAGGFAYEAYVRQKMRWVVDYVGDMLTEIAGFQPESPESVAISSLLDDWCRENGAVIASGPIPLAGNVARRAPPAWVRFMLEFDLPFRSRRLRFVIRQLNLTYAEAGDAGPPSGDEINTLKTGLHEVLDAMRRRTSASFVSKGLTTTVRNTFGVNPAATSADAVGPLIDALAEEIDLRRLNRRVDALLAAIPRSWGEIRMQLLTAYVGFAFWDPLTLSLTSWREAEEYEEIRVHRISPEDATTIRKGGAGATLKGVDFGHFGAFFSRKRRENDYLWGRLHAADRLVDVIADAAQRQGVAIKDATTLKKRLFLAILDAEADQLKAVPDLLHQIKAEVRRI